MHGARVIRLADTETISLGPASNYRPIVGDDAGTTPVRTGDRKFKRPICIKPNVSRPHLPVNQTRFAGHTTQPANPRKNTVQKPSITI